MFLRKMLLATAFAFGAAVSGAHAVTVPNVSGNVCEGGVTPSVGSPCPFPLDLGDFNTAVDDPTLEIVGDTRIWGGVAHRNSNRNQFFDNFTLDLGSKRFQATFNWQPVSTNFDASIIVGGSLYVASTVFPGRTIDLGVLTGDDIIFIINPIAGIFPDSPDEIATWDLELAVVPLPAGALLLLSALGGLAAARRVRRRS